MCVTKVCSKDIIKKTLKAYYKHTRIEIYMLILVVSTVVSYALPYKGEMKSGDASDHPDFDIGFVLTLRFSITDT